MENKGKLVAQGEKVTEYCNVLDLHDTTSSAIRNKLQIDFIQKFMFQDDITARSNFESQNQVDLLGEVEEFIVAERLKLKFNLLEYSLL